jgi:hypothetical protein
MEKIIKLLEEKGIIKIIKAAEKKADITAGIMNIEKTDNELLIGIKTALLRTAVKNEELFDAIIDYAFEAVAKEVMELIKEE